MTSNAGLATLFALVLVDSLGLPTPGDTAVFAAGAFAADGRFSLTAVIAVASVAAFLGDTIVYWVGRTGGRSMLQRDGWHADRRRSLLMKADRFYARYGLVAVYVGKFIPGVRAVGALTAGTSRMPWGGFAAVNAAACLSWTTVVAAAGFAAGPSLLLPALGAGLLVVALAWAVRRTAANRRRRERFQAAGSGSYDRVDEFRASDVQHPQGD